MDERLVRAVIRRVGGRETLKDVCESGADAGFPGFTYYKDTISFYNRWEEEIWELLEEMAEPMGEKPLELISHFGCADSMQDPIGFKNGLAWFALEEVARYCNPDF